MKISDEAVEAAARGYYEGLGWDWDDLGGWDEDQRREREHEDNKAVILQEFRTALEAAAPYLMPDREALIVAIAGPNQDWLTKHVAGLVADRVLALLSRPEVDCNCGFGGFHDDANQRCDRNQASEVPSDQPS